MRLFLENIFIFRRQKLSTSSERSNERFKKKIKRNKSVKNTVRRSSIIL